MSAVPDRDATLFMLLGTTPYLPLYWVNGYSAKGIVCRMFSPENQAQRQRLLDVQTARQPVPCLMKDPSGQRWWHFDAYLAEVQAVPEIEATFVPASKVQVSEVSRYAPLRLRQKRRDAGQPRTRKAVPVVTQGG